MKNQLSSQSENEIINPEPLGYYDSLHQIYPEEMIENYYLKNDSIVNANFKKEKINIPNEIAENVHKFRKTSNKDFIDSLAFRLIVYINYQEYFSQRLYWLGLKKEKDTILTFKNKEIGYISFYDDKYMGNTGIDAYPTVLSPLESDNILT